MKKALFLMTAAGAACAASANPVIEFVPAYKHPISPIAIQQISTGVTVAPGAGNFSRDSLVPYNTVDARTHGLTNWAKSQGQQYVDGSAGGYTARNFTTPGPVANTTPTFNFMFDNNTPDNPNDDFLVNAITDIIFDDFDFDQSIVAGDAYDRFLLTAIKTTFAMNNQARDDNGTPDNPNDDFPVPRTNTLVTGFWGLNDNGTPMNPNDDFIEFTDGVNLSFNFGAASNFIYSMALVDLTGLPDGGIIIPGQGILMQDWAATSPNHPSGDNGAGMGFTGGDSRHDGTATGLDGVVIPPAEDLWTAAGDIVTYGAVAGNPDSGWAWFTSNPTLVGAGATYDDVLFAGYGVEWTFGIPVGSNGNLGPGRYDLAENLGYLLQVEADPANPCRADLTGSSDPNDPSYGVPDGSVDASDFFFYLDAFVAGNLAIADLTGSSDPNDPSYGIPDGNIDASDFFFYLDLFVAGCP
ncbi:MAG: hypothetical protein KIT24_09790 [Phycisphaeraceae bacterium]|nr:hypothetical protein [Phycisphaeraceae bacterium]